MRTRGVLALQPESRACSLVPEQRRQLETFAALTAIALERVHYVEVAQNATVQIESERLRNSLLAALSHDLRTPLAGLVGLAESLQMTRAGARRSASARSPRSSSTSAMRMSRPGQQPARHGAHRERRVPADVELALDRGDGRQRVAPVEARCWPRAP